MYGPLANGATTFLFESIPTYPDASRYWAMVERHKITQLYTAPTAIRALMRFGDDPVTKVCFHACPTLFLLPLIPWRTLDIALLPRS